MGTERRLLLKGMCCTCATWRLDTCIAVFSRRLGLRGPRHVSIAPLAVACNPHNPTAPCCPANPPGGGPLLPSKKEHRSPHLAAGSRPRPTAVSRQPRGIARPSSCRLSSAASAAAAAATAKPPPLLPAAAAVAAADAAAAGLGGPRATSGSPSSCSQVHCCASLHTYTHAHIHTGLVACPELAQQQPALSLTQTQK